MGEAVDNVVHDGRMIPTDTSRTSARSRPAAGASASGTLGDRPVVRRLPRPKRSAILTTDLLAIAGFVTVVSLGFWVVNGGLAALLGGGVETLSGLGQVSGLIAALAALGGLILTSRPVWLERRYGQDNLIAAHRWFGIVTGLALLVHVIADTWAWGAATGGTIITGIVDLWANQEWMVAAIVGTVLIFVLGLTSWRRLRQRLPYETWYFIHLTGYLAVLLGFGHQLTLGTDFSTDTLAFWWWIAVFVATAMLILWSRVGDMLRAWTRPFFVTAVSREASGIGSLHISGSGLHRLRVAGGQYFNVRPLARGLWWQAHPYSVSAAPTTAGMRFSIKELGEDSADILRVKPGTRVVLEGPYGVFTVDKAGGAPVVLVAGGAGISPIRALLEDCGPHQRPIVIVRVRDADDLAHRAELERMVAARDGELHVLTGPRQWFSRVDPFAPETLRAWIPDLRGRQVFVCGPASLEHAVMTGMRKAGVPSDHIHHERFGV
jgi:predicted ferric reductase